jgi:hypothetical protein
MDKFDKFYAFVGDGVRLYGIGATIYGMVNRDMENILGGLALICGGQSINNRYTNVAIGEIQAKKLEQIASKLEKIAEKKE